MENITLSQPEKTPDPDSLFLASLILQDVHETIRCIQTIVAALLRYVNMGMSITNRLMDMALPTESQET